jgi:hypothetical protein
MLIYWEVPVEVPVDQLKNMLPQLLGKTFNAIAPLGNIALVNGETP